MKQEIIIKITEEILTPTQFANNIAKNGITKGMSFWCTFGSTDVFKCIAISHGHNIKRGMISVESKYIQLTIV